MRNTFKVLFYAAKGKEKNGIVPILGRVTAGPTHLIFDKFE
jgi:hypothetical protein